MKLITYDDMNLFHKSKISLLFHREELLNFDLKIKNYENYNELILHFDSIKTSFILIYQMFKQKYIF